MIDGFRAFQEETSFGAPTFPRCIQVNEAAKDSVDGSSRRLQDDQLAAFDTEYVTEERWPIVRRCLDQQFVDGCFSFLDVGGGNGVFADRILANYPGANATVLDSSEMLLARNRPHPRKALLHASAEDLGRVLERSYDVVFFNWVLHHLVAHSYAATLRSMRDTLVTATSCLTNQGRISVFENIYDGLVVDAAPSRLIYWLTSSPSLAQLTRRMGANTAGVGVCFLSRRGWEAQLARVGLRTVRYTDDRPWKLPMHRRVLLHLGRIRCGHFWVEPARPLPQAPQGRVE